MAVVSKAMAEELANLQKRDEDRLRKQGGGNAALAFAKDVKQSLLFKYDWSELLSAAPMCLALMGSCFVAATSPKATGMSLKECEPRGGFKKIGNPELRACLVQVADTGRFAFIEAEKKMSMISDRSSSIGDSLRRANDYLVQLPAPDAAMMLNIKLDALKTDSDECLRYAQDIESKFKDWLELVCEVHQVTVAKEEKTSIDQQDNEIKIAGVSIESELTEYSLKNAEESAKIMKENMEKSRNMFEKAADAIPGPLEQVGIQLVASLAQAATTTISQGLPAMMGMMTSGPMGAAATKGASKKSNPEQRGKKGSKSVAQPDVNIPDAQDPAYPAAVLANVPITLLVTLLGVGKKTGVDWEHLNPVTAAGKTPKEGLTFIEATLKHTLENTEWTEGKASQQLKEVLENLTQVISGVKTEAAKDKALTAKKLSADSEQVKTWQKTAADAKAETSKMATTAASLPGSAPGSAPIIGKTPAATGDASQAGATAAIQSAQEKLAVTEAAYTSAQANYQKTVENRSKVEAELARIKANLKGLQLSQASLEEIKKVLMQCIGTLIQMKAQITNLVMFFSALSAMVEHVVKGNVRDFLAQINVAKTCMIGNISLSDVSRQELFTTTLTVQAYFSLFQTIANMYTKISIDHIRPGITLCDDLSRSTSNPDAMNQRMKALNQFTDNAQAAVREEVAKAQKTTTNSLQQRVDSVQAETRLLPALPPNVKAAITDGKETVTDAVAKGIEEHNNPIVAADTGFGMDALD